MQNTDREDMNNARNSVLYGNVKNSIVEWTLTPAWTAVPPGYVGAKVRGSVVISFLPHGHRTTKFVANGAVSGEIHAKTCGCKSCQ